jgi:hypothetical protein
MKITKTQLRKLIKEATQGEMEFAKLETAVDALRKDRRNDDLKGVVFALIEVLVEPEMKELGTAFLEGEAWFNRGEIVFEFWDPKMEVVINPVGAMGRYDVQIIPMDESLTFDPIQMSVDTMKGALQFISDTIGGEGMVGEPEAQTELPFGEGGLAREHKTRITKSQLQQVVREELLKEVEIGRGPSDRMEDYESDYRDPPSPVDPLLAAAEAAYHELGDWLGHVDADENTGRVLDQLAAAINNAGGNA